MTSFTAIPSLLQYAAFKQDGEKLLKCQSIIEKGSVDKNKSFFAEELKIV